MAGSTGPTRSSVTRGRRLGVLGLLLAAALLLLTPAGSAQAAGDEGMDSFVAVYDLQPDGSMKVTETITWRFPSGEQRHGIFRNIVVRMGWNDEENRYRYFDLTDVAVSSPTGAPDDFRVSDNGASEEIRIGSADQFTSGTQVYTVSYTLHDVLNPITADGKPAPDSSQAATVELYYNVFGTNETTARDRVSITVNAPTGSTQVACYQGVSRSDTPCQATSGDPARFSAAGLTSGDAMSVLASYPASAFGDVRADVREGDSGASIGSDAAPAANAAAWAGAVGAPVLALAVMGALVWTRGRDERYADLTPGLSPAYGTGATGDGTPAAATVRGGSSTVAVQFQPPKGVQPGMVGHDHRRDRQPDRRLGHGHRPRGARLHPHRGERRRGRRVQPHRLDADPARAAGRRAAAALRAPAARRHLLQPGRRRAPLGAEEHLREHPQAHPERDVPGGRDARVVPLLAPDPARRVAGRSASSSPCSAASCSSTAGRRSARSSAAASAAGSPSASGSSSPASSSGSSAGGWPPRPPRAPRCSPSRSASRSTSRPPRPGRSSSTRRPTSSAATCRMPSSSVSRTGGPAPSPTSRRRPRPRTGRS